MKKCKLFWDSLEDVTTVSKRELFLELVCCALAGIILGAVLSPKKTSILGSYNGNGNGQSDADTEDELED